MKDLSLLESLGFGKSALRLGVVSLSEGHSGEQCQGRADEDLRETRFNTFSKKIPLLPSMWNLLVALI